MATASGWIYLALGVALAVWIARSHNEDDWAICESSQRINFYWWVPFTGWVWDRWFWVIVGAVFYPVTIWPYLAVIRPSLKRARLASDTHHNAR